MFVKLTFCLVLVAAVPVFAEDKPKSGEKEDRSADSAGSRYLPPPMGIPGMARRIERIEDMLERMYAMIRYNCAQGGGLPPMVAVGMPPPLMPGMGMPPMGGIPPYGARPPFPYYGRGDKQQPATSLAASEGAPAQSGRPQQQPEQMPRPRQPQQQQQQQQQQPQQVHPQSAKPEQPPKQVVPTHPENSPYNPHYRPYGEWGPQAGRSRSIGSGSFGGDYPEYNAAAAAYEPFPGPPTARK